MNAGVKGAALVNYERFASHPVSSASKGQTKTDRSLIAKLQSPQGANPKPSLPNSAVVKTTPASSPAPKAVAKKHANNSSVTKKAAKKAHKKSVAKATAKKPTVSAAPATAQGKSIPSQASPGSSKKSRAQTRKTRSFIRYGESGNKFSDCDVVEAPESRHAEATDTGPLPRTWLAESRGSRKGVIVDLEKAVSSIQKAVEQAEHVRRSD
jgi:hypothetical protein